MSISTGAHGPSARYIPPLGIYSILQLSREKPAEPRAVSRGCPAVLLLGKALARLGAQC
jgi:hypothetical protein